MLYPPHFVTPRLVLINDLKSIQVVVENGEIIMKVL